jgi:transcriptional regulator NrdR family protein
MRDAPQKPVDPADQVGLCCRKCGNHAFKVIYTRPGPRGVVVRRRACRQCGTRITTKEREVGS